MIKGKGSTGETQKRAAIYVRVSTKGQEEEGASLATQEEQCRRYAAQKGYVVEEEQVYREVHTGSELWERQQLTKLREAVRRRAVDVFVAYAIDRLSRDPVHLGVVVSEADYAGVEVEFVTEPLDNTSEGQLVRFVRGYAAKVEHEKIRERTLRGKRARAESGKVHNHSAELYGYRRNKAVGVREIYEPEAAVVRKIFNWVAVEGLSLRAIVRRLNSEGVPPASQGKVVFSDPNRRAVWGKGQLFRILKHPAYKGEGVAWRLRRDGSMRPPEEWVHLPAGAVPALVDPVIWDAAQARLETNKGATTRNETRPYLLRGLITCKICGHPMHCQLERGRRIYRCSSREKPSGPCGAKRVNADMAESWVWEQIADILRNPETIVAEVRRRVNEGPDPALHANRDSAQRALAKIEQDQAKLRRRLVDAADDDLLWEVIRGEISRLEQERKSLQEMIDQLDEQIVAATADLAQLDALADYCARVATNLESFGFDEKRTALEAVGAHVTANGREWQVQGTIPLEDDGSPAEEKAGVLSPAC